MPLYIIERNFAKRIQPRSETGAAIKQINADMGVNWYFSFLSADKRKTYCLMRPKPLRQSRGRATGEYNQLM